MADKKSVPVCQSLGHAPKQLMRGLLAVAKPARVGITRLFAFRETVA